MREDVERLILQARRDLENARKNITIDAYEVAAFLSHQAVEKYLQGSLILWRRARPPATHYLRQLGDGLRMPRRLIGHLLFLNPDYTVARYPDAASGVPYELYDKATAEAKVAAATEVAKWAEERLKAGNKKIGR